MPTFELFVDDNYHYMDEQARYSAGSFASYEEALTRARSIVDEFLADGYRPGMTSGELYQGYVGFGEDPFIVPAGDPPFSAWDYARTRCAELCREEDAVASVLRFPAWPAELAGLRVVVLAALRRQDLGARERAALEELRGALEGYPHRMPRDGGYYWLRAEHGDVAFTAYLHSDRVKLSARGISAGPVDWELRFYGSGRCDRRDGEVHEALVAMVQAAANPDFTVEARG